jgi:hypothetical protein
MKHSGIAGASFESVYGFVTGEQRLGGAHDSLFDAYAQYYDLKDNCFRAYILKMSGGLTVRWGTGTEGGDHT